MHRSRFVSVLACLAVLLSAAIASAHGVHPPTDDQATHSAMHMGSESMHPAVTIFSLLAMMIVAAGLIAYYLRRRSIDAKPSQR